MSVNEMFRIIIKGISHILSHSLSNGIFSEIRVPMRGSPDAADRDKKNGCEIQRLTMMGEPSHHRKNSSNHRITT